MANPALDRCPRGRRGGSRLAAVRRLSQMALAARRAADRAVRATGPRDDSERRRGRGAARPRRRCELEHVHPGREFYRSARSRQATRPESARISRAKSGTDLLVASANGTFIDAAEAKMAAKHFPDAAIYAPKPALGEERWRRASGSWSALRMRSDAAVAAALARPGNFRLTMARVRGKTGAARSSPPAG